MQIHVDVYIVNSLSQKQNRLRGYEDASQRCTFAAQKIQLLVTSSRLAIQPVFTGTFTSSLCCQIQWQYEVDSRFQSYDSSTSALIEKAYRKNSSIVQFEETDDGKHDVVPVEIDLQQMEEYVNGDRRNPRKVKRTVISGSSAIRNTAFVRKMTPSHILKTCNINLCCLFDSFEIATVQCCVDD